MVCLFLVSRTCHLHSYLVRAEAHWTNSYNQRTNIRQGSRCRWETSCSKCEALFILMVQLNNCCRGLCLFPDAKHRPEGLSSDVGGIRNATSGSATDKLTREHRMTLDEAHLILNAKRGETTENIMKASESQSFANSMEHLTVCLFRTMTICSK